MLKLTPPRKLALSMTVLLILAGLATWWMLGGLTSAIADGQAATTSTQVASSGPVASTTTIVQGAQVPGNGPEAFTTLAAPGPVQVLVVKVECAGYVGDGWWITWKVTNAGGAREGALLAQIDNNGEPQTLVPNLQLPAGGQTTQRQVVKGSGDSVMVTWANADRPVRSAIEDTVECKQNPADLQDARKATTTT